MTDHKNTHYTEPLTAAELIERVCGGVALAGIFLIVVII